MSIAQNKHAVVTDTHIIWISVNERKLTGCKLKEELLHISELWQIGKDTGITHFWIMPNTLIEQAGWDFLKDREGYKIFIPGEERGIEPKSATCKKGFTAGLFEINVNYPEHGNGFGWAVEKPLDVLATVDYLSQVLGTSDITFSAMHIGKEHLRWQYHRTKRMQSHIAKPDTDLSKIPFRRSAPEIYFSSPLTQDMIGMFYHLVDKNAAHPSAAASMMTGTGNPLHLVQDTNYMELKKPGLYRVSFEVCNSPFDGKQLPLIIESEWVTLDVLKFARKYGYMVEIHEAYVFSHGYQVFDEWARELWKARQALKDTARFPYEPARLNAYFTMKEIMNKTISSMKENVNWWCDMVSLARVTRLANLYKCMTEDNQLPLYVYVDDVAFVSPEPTVEQAIPSIFKRKLKTDGSTVDNRSELGGYKSKYSFQITAEMVAECPDVTELTPAQAAGRMHAYMKRVATEKGLIND